jgi:1-acyl-sn-glycerol-3-phosphate acyltransferase
VAKPVTGFAGQTLGVKILYNVCRSAVCWFTQMYTRMTFEGKNNLPTSGAYVLAPVHRSYVDTPIVACIMARRIRFMGKDTMWKHETLGKLFSALGAFPVSRGTADREALKRSIEALTGGEPLVLFPEGERKDGPLVHELFDGAAYVAAKAGVPIIPIGIGGSARVMPRGAKFVFPRKVHIVIGKPMRSDVGESGKASRKSVAALTERLHCELQLLYDHAQSVVG